MASRFADYVQQGGLCAQQATAEDNAHNYDAAVNHYWMVVDWFMLALKSGAINDQMKQNIRAKVTSYMNRRDEINKILTNGPGEENAVVDGGAGRRNARDDDVNGDPERKRMMRKFEGAIVNDPNVSFDDVVGLEQAKDALKEAVILPVKFPHLFQGKRKPWAGILLYGPPGTGKSYLAKAIATQCKSTFISVTSSDLLSKWLGESDKGVKCLFEVARERQPCIVFIDEIDALCGQRSDNESESSRRVKTEFLVQMEGVRTNNLGVLVLAATNIPWALDSAIRQCFEKHIYISLPGVNERAAMFKTHLGTTTVHTIYETEWMGLAQRSEHYSGADIRVVCREAVLRPIRQLGSATYFKRVENPNSGDPSHLWLACSPEDPDGEELTVYQIQPEELFELPVTISDMIAALATQKPTVSENDLIKYEKFTEQYGQEGS